MRRDRTPHAWIDALAATQGLTLEVGEPLTAHGQRLMDAMGVHVLVIPGGRVAEGTSGRTPPRYTRATMSDETRERLRAGYLARAEPMRRPTKAAH